MPLKHARSYNVLIFSERTRVATPVMLRGGEGVGEDGGWGGGGGGGGGRGGGGRRVKYTGMYGVDLKRRFGGA